MLRILTLSIVLVGVIYCLPFLSGDMLIEEIDVETVAEFSIDNIIQIKEREKISVSIDGSDKVLEINDFLTGVLAAEMPASFEEEALKAQAVAARTYIYYKQNLIDSGLSDGVHPNSVVCTDFNHCKAYIDLNDKNPWGDNYDKYYDKLKNAVLSTDKEYIVYNEEPIAAVFHAASSGITEKAKDVWGNDIPYLQSVVSEGSKDSPNFEKIFSFSFNEFKDKIESKYPDIILESDPKQWFKSSTRSESGGIISVYVGDTLVKGVDVRSLFGLNSTNFTIDFTDSDIIFSTKGYGHGVGLSQYGANKMAKDGKSYKEILAWYYVSTEIFKK